MVTFFDTNLYNISSTTWVDELLTVSLSTSPLFWIWISSVVVWFFLELAIWESCEFNLKHMYFTGINRQSVFLNHLNLVLVSNVTKNMFLQQLYFYYI